MRINNGGPDASLDSIVLFPFDDHSIPFQHGVKLNLRGKQSGHGNKPVVPVGDPGTPDSEWIAYYGTVLRIGGELMMWYLGQGPDEHWHQRVCLARSKDGRRWEKPDLGLVEYHGGRHNNLVDMGRTCTFRRAWSSTNPKNQTPTSASRWPSSRANTRGVSARVQHGRADLAGVAQQSGRRSARNGGRHQVGRLLLPGRPRGEARFGGAPAGHQRLLRLLALGRCNLLRPATHNVSPQPPVAGKNAGEQVHLGAALWNRSNVVIGFFGKWNGHPSNDRRMVTMDLGFAVSNDGLHYREPIPDFPIVSAAEDSWGLKRRESLALNFPALIQGQGFENVGDETLFWYAPWPEEASDGVRVTGWPRDRLGYFSPYEGGIWAHGGVSDPHFVSAPVDLEGGVARLAVNVEGINEHSSITAEI